VKIVHIVFAVISILLTGIHTGAETIKKETATKEGYLIGKIGKTTCIFVWHDGICYMPPIKYGKYISRGPGWHNGKYHEGTDIAAKRGTPIIASATGIVSKSGWNNGYGQNIVIEHPNGTKTRYAHNSRNLVKKGQIVERGQTIALIGSTGRSTAPHLHFEIHGAPQELSFRVTRMAYITKKMFFEIRRIRQ